MRPKKPRTWKMWAVVSESTKVMNTWTFQRDAMFEAVEDEEIVHILVTEILPTEVPKPKRRNKK